MNATTRTTTTPMRINTTIILTLFCACLSTARAQNALISRMDSIMEARNRKAFAKYDTAYIGKPEQLWAVRIRTSSQGTDLRTRGNLDGLPFSSDLTAQPKNTIGASISYRGVSAGFSISPTKLAGKNKDNEFNFSSYGNRIGFDFSYMSAKTFSGNARHGDTPYDINAGSVTMKMLQTSAYYSFNNKRFSFPAVFSHSQVQKRSCGSLMLGLAAFAGRIKSAAGTIPGSNGMNLSLINIAIGGGYAYNLVLKKAWLIHISAMPHLVVFSRNKLTVGDTRQRTPFKFPSLINVGRLALVHNFKNKFIGASVIINLWHQGDKNKMKMESLKWRAQLFYGFRF